MCVQILDGVTYLYNVVLDFRLDKLLSPPQQLIERLILTEFKENVDILRVFKIMLKLNNVLVVQRAMDLDLAHQLLLRPRLR